MSEQMTITVKDSKLGSVRAIKRALHKYNVSFSAFATASIITSFEDGTWSKFVRGKK